MSQTTAAVPKANPRNVRKRVGIGSGSSPSSGGSLPINYYYNYNDKGRYMIDSSGKIKQSDSTWSKQIRNTIRAMFVMSLPICIFIVPFLLSSSHNNVDNSLDIINSSQLKNTRIVATMSTTMDRILSIQPTINSILYQQTIVPTILYLIIVTSDDSGSIQQQEEEGEKSITEQEESWEKWPNYIQELIKASILKIIIIQENKDDDNLYGGDNIIISKLLLVLEQENKKKQEENVNTIDGSYSDKTLSSFQNDIVINETRIILLNDDIIYDKNTICNLIIASFKYPQYAIGFSGGKLRSQFRQVLQYDADGHDDEKEKLELKTINKFPNIVLQTYNTMMKNDDAISKYIKQQKEPYTVVAVDILQEMNGICFALSVLDYKQIQQLWKQTIAKLIQDQEKSTSSLSLLSSDIVLNGILEVQNVSRIVVPYGNTDSNNDHDVPTIQFTNYSTKMLLSTKSETTTSHRFRNNIQWMKTIYCLQQEWYIWDTYEFINPTTLTDEQIHAMKCESNHQQDCTTNHNVCIPNPQYCPTAHSILNEIEPTIDNEKEFDDDDDGDDDGTESAGDA